ncbi:Acetyltransferase (GNAT) family protein [Klenkia soli]|uniref:Acetyltransferase (GNAT) family protein n=1 Tax=Klenkia soli TaxID=1052260 RepID=A0A1H0S2X5_9ACTN|nr:GNAT family N-acetyltransferase [Klenkia soli]SDP36034.1 Acetyltransferase (GNAT) family protein [Klenkia soli]
MAGDPPPADGTVTTRPAPLGAPAVVVGGTAWACVAADVDPGWVTAWIAASPDPVAAPLSARFLAALADETGVEPGVVDAVLVAPHVPVAPGLPVQPLEAADHPRVQRAHRHRTDVRVLGTPDGSALLSVGRGLAGRWEVSVEVDPAARRRGLGTALAAAAPALVDGPLWAQVAPANVASLRSFLAAGYRVVCAESLFGS